jgi:hypothetical protein
MHKRINESVDKQDFFITTLQLRPFGCLINPKEGYAILREQNRLHRKNQIGPVTAKYDMTAGIIMSLPHSMDRSIVNHNLIIAVDIGQRNRALINLMEFLTDTSNVVNLKPTFDHLRAQYNLIEPGRKPFDMVVTDHCWAALTALIEGLNKMSKQAYFERSYEAFTDPSKAETFFDECVLVLICSSHTANTLNHDLLKAYKQGHLTKEEYHFLAALIGHLYAIRSVDECDAYIDAVFALLCHKHNDDSVR